MERFYRALRVLCVAAISVGILAACLVSFEHWWFAQFHGTEVTPTITSPRVLYDLAMQPFYVGHFLLASGACVMGVVLAWLDHRKRWFVALIIVILIVYVGTNLLSVWLTWTPSQFLPGWAMLLEDAEYSFLLTVFLPPFIAVLTTLAFARGTQQERVAVDAVLGLSRSAL